MAKMHPFWWFIPKAVKHKMLAGVGTIYAGESVFRYLCPMGINGIDEWGEIFALQWEERAYIIVPFDCTLRNLYVHLALSPDETGCTYYKLTVRKNGADTSLTVTITGSDTSGSDTIHTVTLTKGDTVSLSTDTDRPGSVDKNTVSWGIEVAV